MNIFLSLLHSVHDSGRRAILFSRTSFTALGRPPLPSDMQCSHFQERKSVFQNNKRGPASMFAFLNFFPYIHDIY